MAEVLVFYTKVTPRHIKRLEALQAHVPDLAAVEVAGSEKPYPWWQDDYQVGVRKITLFSDPLESIGRARQIQACRELLAREAPRVVVVSSHVEPVMRYTARHTRTHGGRAILMLASWAGDRRRWFPKEQVKRAVIRRHFDAACVCGERQYVYALQLGFRAASIWKQFNIVDNEHFARGAEYARGHADELRAQLGVPERYFLYVGAFEPWKNLPLLLRAYGRYRAQGGAWALALVGGGTQCELLQQMVQQLGAPGVHFAGMRQYDELPYLYALASCLVLPSLSEPWGLVVNEAAACGLPILASSKCGCVPELVHPGLNGYIFDPEDVHQLSLLMARVSESNGRLAEYGQASRDIVQYYTPERWAASLADCIANVGRISCSDR